MQGTLQKHYRMTPGRDRWDEHFAGLVHAALRVNLTACGRETNTSAMEDVSKTGWVFNRYERSSASVTCKRCLSQLSRS